MRLEGRERDEELATMTTEGGHTVRDRLGRLRGGGTDRVSELAHRVASILGQVCQVFLDGGRRGHGDMVATTASLADGIRAIAGHAQAA